eukprot:gene2567-3529_t
MSITEFGQTTIVISMISYDLGSSSFYVAFLIFMLYWHELTFFRIGIIAKDAVSLTSNYRIVVIVFSIILGIFQLIICSLKLIFFLISGDLYSEQMKVMIATQSGFHAIACLSIAIISLRILIKAYRRESQVKQFQTKMTFVLILMIWLGICLRGVSNIVLAFLEILGYLHHQDVPTLIVNIFFPILFDWIPMMVMGIIALTQDNPTNSDARHSEIQRVLGTTHGESNLCC